MWIERDELLRLRKELNAHPTAKLFQGGKPIEGLTNKEIRREILWWLGELAKMDPENWQTGLPPLAIEAYESWGAKVMTATCSSRCHDGS